VGSVAPRACVCARAFAGCWCRRPPNRMFTHTHDAYIILLYNRYNRYIGDEGEGFNIAATRIARVAHTDRWRRELLVNPQAQQQQVFS